MFYTPEYRGLLESEKNVREAMKSCDTKSLAALAMAHVRIVGMKMEWRERFRARGKTIPIEAEVIAEITDGKGTPAEIPETVTAPPTPQGEIGDSG